MNQARGAGEISEARICGVWPGFNPNFFRARSLGNFAGDLSAVYLWKLLYQRISKYHLPSTL